MHDTCPKRTITLKLFAILTRRERGGGGRKKSDKQFSKRQRISTSSSALSTKRLTFPPLSSHHFKNTHMKEKSNPSRKIHVLAGSSTISETKYDEQINQKIQGILVHRLLELLFLEELKYEKHQFSAQRRHASTPSA